MGHSSAILSIYLSPYVHESGVLQIHKNCSGDALTPQTEGIIFEKRYRSETENETSRASSVTCIKIQIMF